jgi:hypothetical protein
LSASMATDTKGALPAWKSWSVCSGFPSRSLNPPSNLEASGKKPLPMAMYEVVVPKILIDS